MERHELLRLLSKQSQYNLGMFQVILLLYNDKHVIPLVLFQFKHMMVQELYSSYILEVDMVWLEYLDHSRNNFSMIRVMAVDILLTDLAIFEHMELEPSSILGCNCIPFLDMEPLLFFHLLM